VAEALALGIGVVQPPALALAIWLAFTIAHMTTKIPWY